jgi:hypothetical protein
MIYTIEAFTERDFSVGYWHPDLQTISGAICYTTKIEAEQERIKAEQVGKQKGYTLTFKVIEKI